MKATVCDKCKAIVPQGATYYRLCLLASDATNLDDPIEDCEICMKCQAWIKRWIEESSKC